MHSRVLRQYKYVPCVADWNRKQKTGMFSFIMQTHTIRAMAGQLLIKVRNSHYIM